MRGNEWLYPECVVKGQGPGSVPYFLKEEERPSAPSSLSVKLALRRGPPIPRASRLLPAICNPTRLCSHVAVAPLVMCEEKEEKTDQITLEFPIIPGGGCQVLWRPP